MRRDRQQERIQRRSAFILIQQLRDRIRASNKQQERAHRLLHRHRMLDQELDQAQNVNLVRPPQRD